MALVGHLDLMRLFDRSVRRAGLPVAFTGGFHPTPRISIANALPLGVTSSGEIVDFELTIALDAESFRQQLAEVLPQDIPIYSVEALDLKAPACSQALSAVEYLITVASVEQATPAQWQGWIDTIRIKDEIWWEKTTKSGSTQLINLRDRLFELEFIELLTSQEHPEGSAARLRYVGVYRQDGTMLRPEQVLSMLEQVASTEFHLRHIHRNRLVLEGLTP